jgi:tRNA threonylcarbamoyl adenosine modification protein (Sua5/YciO/YrdC/YwlC family)
MIIAINPDYPEPRKVRRAVEALEAGAIIAYPTDTVYGLGCDLTNKKAIERLYQLKGLSRHQPLALICPDLADIARYAHVDNQAYRLLRRLLPGPYTFILEASREVPRMVQTKRRSVGIRVPAHEVIRAIVRALGRPVLSTSAGPHDGEPYIDARDIAARYAGAELVLDGGLGGTVGSTVVDLMEGVVVREGAGPIDDLF